MSESEKKYAPMIEFCGECYYIDVERMSKFLIAESDEEKPKTVIEHFDKDEVLFEKTITTVENKQNKHYDNVKFEIIRYLLETLMTEETELDETLGTEKAMKNLPLNTKLAFNTLAGYGILKRY